MRVVITGATGTIGMALIEELRAHGDDVLVLARPNSPRSVRLHFDSAVIVADCALEQMGTFDASAYGKWDAFIHLAWVGTSGAGRNDMYMQHLNVRYSLDAVNLAHRMGCDVFIGAGSQAEYGITEQVMRPDTPTHPNTGYGMAKLCAGLMTRSLCADKGMRHVWARILSVYGPYDSSHTMIMSGIAAMLAGKVAEFTKGEQIWDFLFCKDAARALRLMAQKGKDGAVYCLASGRARPLKEYIMMLRNLIDPSLAIDFGAIPYSKGQIMYLHADISPLTEDTGFLPNYSFQQGASETIEWMRQDARISNHIV